MIERIHVNERYSKIVKHNGVVYLTGQVAEGDTIQEQVRVFACKRSKRFLTRRDRLKNRC